MQITLECLRTAMGDKLGSVLTPELAASIEFLAFDRADAAFEPGIFDPRQYRNLTFQAESFRRILPELEPLHEQHFAETEQHLKGSLLQPNYDYMAERERTRGLIQFTARTEDGKLVGNLRMYINRSMHTGDLVAEEDTFFLLPAYRKGYAAASFLRYAEEALVNIVGVREIRANTKVVNAASKLMDYRGYRHVANQYIKVFEGK